MLAKRGSFYLDLNLHFAIFERFLMFYTSGSCIIRRMYAAGCSKCNNHQHMMYPGTPVDY